LILSERAVMQRFYFSDKAAGCLFFFLTFWKKNSGLLGFTALLLDMAALIRVISLTVSPRGLDGRWRWLSFLIGFAVS